MQHANEKERKVQRLPSALLANQKEGELFHCLAFRDLEDGLIVQGWSFNLSQYEFNCPEEAIDKYYLVS